MEFWKILRILTTNQCNYRCLYCHNEGQIKDDYKENLPFDNFTRIARLIEGMGFKEIRFSGGEPLVNPDTIRMIEWLDANSDYEIGLASNGSLINDDCAEKLGRTRVMLTLHFPAVKDSEYNRITGMQIKAFWDAVERLDRYEVKHSFNYVLYPDSINNVIEVVDSVITKGKRVKLLPFIEEGFNNYSVDSIEWIKNRLDDSAISKETFDAGGITTWTFSGGGKVKLLNSPCYDHNIEHCREYGELRLLPDMSLQKCIFDNNVVKLDGLSDAEIKNHIVDLWQSFNKCLYG